MAAPLYGEISDLLKSGHVVPFVGAGVNFGTRQAGVDINEFVNKMRAENA